MRECAREIYRIIEECPECGHPMEVDPSISLTTMPPQFIWRCSHCKKTITSYNDGKPRFDWVKEND